MLSELGTLIRCFQVSAALVHLAYNILIHANISSRNYVVIMATVGGSMLVREKLFIAANSQHSPNLWLQSFQTYIPWPAPED